ncbi:VOC family protein [Nocardia alni]|uniref:VOC family protein n=1 Tax=Nocardia alni TaxID=2815723 RepID=UPI001C2413C8|nr:VOC family protein [Nocardia alni]
MADAQPAPLVTHLRHVALAVPDLAAQRRFLREVWGLTEVADDGDLVFFAAEGSPERYVMRVRRDAAKRMDLVAFGAPDRAAVDALTERLIAANIPLVGEPATLRTLGGGYGVRFFDPDGRVVEVSCDVVDRTHRRIEEREGIPVRISHCVVNSPDPARLRTFYETVLDFRLSDTLWSERMGDLMYFLRCNPQHHSFAIARGPHPSLHHVSFEMRGLDEYLRGTGRALRAGTPLCWGPGRHLAGDNTFSYFHDPHGNTVEFTTALAILDQDHWHPRVHDAENPEIQDQWGTADPFTELIAKGQFNDPDVLFTPPPI